ncbi:biopolymer transporter ExbD [Winogradskyella maritima]|nr:biopolymer transporter ExbD [Winogradskyella maritima]
MSTASLPDIVFILLFFFMTVTVMKNQNLLVANHCQKPPNLKSYIRRIVS